MKKRLTIGVIVTALAATMSFVAAGPYQDKPVTAADALPRSEIVARVQSLGLVPTTRVLRRGPFYVLHALDRRGTELRVVTDAALGDILSVTPVYVPRFDAGPRIIHVPPRGERADKRDGAALPDDEVVERTPTPRQHAVRQPHRAKRRVPPPHPRRSISSAPSPVEGLSPIHPTPKFTTKFNAPDEAVRDSERAPENEADSQASNDAEKFRAPDEPADRTRLPPPGYTPPPAQQPAQNDAPPAQDESVNSNSTHSRASGNPEQ